MSIILGIETSCDETAASIYNSKEKKLLSSVLFSQIKLHEIYGGVVPEIASRSHLEKIDIIIQNALDQAKLNLDNIDCIAITNKPGLVGSLLIGLCFAKSIAFVKNKKLIAVDHIEGHIFSSYLNQDFTIRDDIEFPHICLSASGGSTALYLVEDFGKYKIIGQTLDDAAGEAFDKVAKIIGFGYPGGAKIEKSAQTVNFQDFFKYPRLKNKKDLNLSFSGLKTAVLYDLINKNFYDLKTGPKNINTVLQNQVSSSLLVCISNIFEDKIKQAFKLYPQAKAFTFVGGVACNNYIKTKLENVCDNLNKHFVSPHCKFCGDNAAMIAFVGAYKAKKNEIDNLYLDVFK
ncbi:tRNA (adenosine(37)-N6)-threonylcarbamoyltransferase complex transferase subunit TsaD [Candidatus Babeliales bacterium]|nr:tRNA (adenosine(37)-N6)-threonylcarbamoyltransferase complex transferase subunit TsaD [Candidatus Babeliales bacterium]MCF7899216.1 tRNA (adenosine(37)-N6)-threonylcarbamoyltransferase complex transferase subunit TsaD [Candidatus Babeliales bacterium]